MYIYQINKAGYTAIEVAYGWAVAVMKKDKPSIWAGAVMQKPTINAKKLIVIDRLTHQLTNIEGYRVACKKSTDDLKQMKLGLQNFFLKTTII